MEQESYLTEVRMKFGRSSFLSTKRGEVNVFFPADICEQGNGYWGQGLLERKSLKRFRAVKKKRGGPYHEGKAGKILTREFGRVGNICPHKTHFPVVRGGRGFRAEADVQVLRTKSVFDGKANRQGVRLAQLYPERKNQERESSGIRSWRKWTSRLEKREKKRHKIVEWGCQLLQEKSKSFARTRGIACGT